MSNERLLDRKVIYGLVMVTLVALIVVGTIAKYKGTFDRTVDVTVESDRAGLTLSAGTPVKLYGVEVGKVGDIDSDGDKVTIELKLDSGEVKNIPAGLSAQLVPPTAFGAKYVQLTPTGDTDGDTIEAGAIIPADQVTVEVDEAFQNLTQVLDVAKPAQVNQALTAVAGALDQRGELIGQLITQTDAYLTSFNPSLQTLSDDLRQADDVADIYDVARPDLIDTFDNLGTTSQTLVDQQASLRALELSLTSFSNDTDTLVKSSRTGIVTSLNLLDPVTKVLARYSPELPCVVLGLASANKLAEAAVGGTNPGVTTITKIVPGRDPYSYPENVPQIGENRGPVCFGLPYVTPEEAEQPAPNLKTGANPYAGPQPSAAEQLQTTLANLIQGGANLP